MKSHMIANRASTLFLGLIIPVLIVISMETVARLELTANQLFVPPKVIFETLVDLLKSGDLLRNLAISILRISTGFLVGSVAGLLFGAAMGISRTFEDYVGPLFHGLRQIPVLAWIPLLMLWIGIGEQFKICFIAVTAFYPMALNASEGVKGVSTSYLEVGHIFEFSRLKQFRTIILPAALPAIFTGLRLSLSISWMAVVGAELVAASEGIGFMMYTGRQQFQLDTVMVCLIAIAMAGYAMSLVLERIEEYSLRWRSPAE
jgi:sulfonate transport system permease protein